jgi:UDP-2,3-diacylglucosamine pyrophosphatase LpxH
MSATQPARERLVIISDLHMATSAGPLPDPFVEDEALARLLGSLASDGRPTRLVLLGDTFDLVLAAGGGLDAIADAHPGVFGALGAFAGAGHSLVVVPGNHDVELMHRPAQNRLRQLVALAAGRHDRGAPIAFRPWIVHVPGVLYAEHGRQHHDVNHFRAVLNGTETTRRRRGSRPPALCLDEGRIELAALRARRAGAAAMAVHVAVLAVAMARSGADLTFGPGPRRRALHERRLRHHAGELGLPADALVEVDRRAAPTALEIGRRTARILGPARGRDGGNGLMPAAAEEVAGVLSRAGAAPPYFVFGHTHVAEDRPLRGGSDMPRYLNAGTWSTLVRPGRDGDEDRLRYVEIEHGGDAPPTARLRRWHDGRTPR